MERFINKVLAAYGAAAEIQRGLNSIQVRAFLQPVRSRSLRQTQLNWTDLGGVPGGQYLYLGPASVALAVDDRIVVGGSTYIVRSTEQMYVKDLPVYTWALCTKRGGTVSWKS